MRTLVQATFAFGTAIFLSAFLLFQVQPIVGKAVLPSFGGSPAVWTTCMLVFQVLLFAGYAYAHFSTAYLSRRVQVLVHMAILLAALTMLPWLSAYAWKPNGIEHPIVRIVLFVLTSIGLPFFLLSSTGPLLQAWYRHAADGPSLYRFYSLSNVGSLLALLSFPFLVEPIFSSKQQTIAWSAGFVAFAAACLYCGWQAATFSTDRAETGFPSPAGDAAPVRPDSWRMAVWFALAMIPSVMLLAVTNQVCQDVASVPFLWILPLSLYLISFIIAFDGPRWYARLPYAIAVAIGGFAMMLMLFVGYALPILIQLAIYMTGLFVSAMYCHGELARTKPDARYLTTFYLTIAAGGAAGGIFASIMAPLLFNAFYELHLSILVMCALMMATGLRLARGIGFQPVADQSEHSAAPLSGRARVARAALLLLPVLTILGLGFEVLGKRENVLFQTRTFHGVLRVVEDRRDDQENHRMRLFHGNICHGEQFVMPLRHRETMAYFDPESGIGLALREHRAERPRRIGVVGLGTGTLASYAKPGDSLVFYELDDKIAEIARTHFTFLEDCAAEYDIVLGDARLALESELASGGPRQFDILVVDAFSGDSIPTHLLTREALGVYLAHLAEDGILAFHITNRHVDLTPVLAALTQEANLAAVVAKSQSHHSRETYEVVWVLAGPRPDAFAATAYDGLPRLQGRGPVWTDDHCSLFSVLKR